MVVIIDYGMGNVGSIKNMLSVIRVESTITSDPHIIKTAEKLILPGVGSFDKAIENLSRLGLISILNEVVLQKKIPILGICLGMQLFSRYSEEGELPGLGWIDAETIRFNFSLDSINLRIPHMGWNTINLVQQNSILKKMPNDEQRFYFVHSYHVRCSDSSNILATTNYGITFTSAVIKENIIGTQFHPEKSHKFGMRVLQNFTGSWQ